MNEQIIAQEFQQQGYIIIPKLFNLEQIVKLKVICDRILNCWIRQSFFSRPKPNKKSLDILKKSEYFDTDLEQLEFLLNAIADKRIISILQRICQRKLIFNGAGYFFNPIGSSFYGDWHRDGQIIAPDNDTERTRILNSSFIRVHLALIDDNFLEIVTGSHARWDTPQELAIRKGSNPRINSSEMPFARRIALQSGDAVFFDGYSIHRGNYFADRSRRTLALLYGSPVDWFNPASNWAIEHKAIDCLSFQQQALFPNLVDTNQS